MDIVKKLYKKTTLIVSTSFVALSFAVAGPAPQASAAGGDCGPNPIAFLPRWYEGLCKNGPNGSKVIKSPAEMGGRDTGEQLGTWLSVIGLNIVTIILYIVGYVSLFFIIWGGFKYMTQGDSSSGTVAARKTIQNAIIGLILSILSVAIVQFIVGRIT